MGNKTSSSVLSLKNTVICLQNSQLYCVINPTIWNDTAVFCYSFSSCLVEFANVLKMYVVLSVCNVVLLKSYHVLSLRSVLLLQRYFVLSNCSVIVLKALLSCLRVVLIFQKDHISCQLAVLLCVQDMLRHWR